MKRKSSEIRRCRRVHIHYSESMFVRRLSIERIDSFGTHHACLLRWIDNFAMRNFTNDAIFDDTLPVADGLLEAGARVPLDHLQAAMEDWFRRKGYLKSEERLEVREIDGATSGQAAASCEPSARPQS